MNYRNILKWIVNVLIAILPNTFFLYVYCNISYYINHFTVARIAKRYNVKQIGDINYHSYKTSDTLFVLGSGSSINGYSKEQWDLIKKHDSVGFNFWLIHDFVPTFYVFEENVDKSRTDTFYKLLHEKQYKYKDVPFIAKDVEVKGVGVNKIPETLRNNLYLSTDLVMPGEDEGKFRTHLKFYDSFTRKKNRFKLKVIPKKRATLSYILLMAKEMNYKKIVLCGVDLIDSRFFYLNKIYNKRLKPEKDLIEDQIHPTNQKHNKTNITISDTIEMLQEELFDEDDIKISVGSKKSALYPRFDYYFEQLKDKESNLWG
ncbi:hypothetical protein V7152_17490 [Neobacillus drentensis]|uniref:hypothetical protein n=1 Tax=Neobacillus drentensis TaxID=220684 RepID=UPI00300045F0